ncbi:hypothetical protein RCG17_22280 [Neobacillus sp. PS3-12]|nr:hypothetical protein [Neobacillus sp. PS3-12]WML52100.1 hypothetical protein RCG17_22280 [Neobacillus sp. PS3-12]
MKSSRRKQKMKRNFLENYLKNKFTKYFGIRGLVNKLMIAVLTYW